LKHLMVMLLLVIAAALCGCQGSKAEPAPLELTFNRGAQLLAAGSPKSAIPFLSQTIASTPDGPEPVALLALAYALDLQSEQAILQARKVPRGPGEAPGWEAVAVGIAETVRHRPEESIASLERVLARVGPESPLVPATRQWLALAQVVKGDHDAALVTLDQLARCPSMRSSALLWTLLIRAHDGQNEPATGPVLYSSNCLLIRARGQTPQAADALAECAGEVVATIGRPSVEGTVNDQTLYDSAIASIAAGKLDNARTLFVMLKQRQTDGGDAGLWLALIAAAQGHWQAASDALSDACDTGPLPVRSLANQLCTVIRAMEDRPESMIQHMLAGQRLLGRDMGPAHVIESPKPEGVWFSDGMK
jgi:thioredoxin-like negative regulator of GroEL